MGRGAHYRKESACGILHLTSKQKTPPLRRAGGVSRYLIKLKINTPGSEGKEWHCGQSAFEELALAHGAAEC